MAEHSSGVPSFLCTPCYRSNALDMKTTSQTRQLENRRRAIVLASGFGAWTFGLVSVIFWILTAWWAPIFVAPAIGLIVAVTWVLVAWKQGPSVVLDLSDVEPASESQHARLFNAAVALSASTGVTPPELYVVDDPAINAMAVGQKSRETAIAVTTGLLDELSVVEVEAVLALIFYRIKSEDVSAGTFAVPTIGAVAVLGEHIDDVPWLSRLLLAPMPVIERFLMWLHPAESEFDVDVASTLITRYPPALASALDKMDGRSALAMGTPVTAHLWLAPPINVALSTASAGIHKPLSERVAVLQEL